MEQLLQHQPIRTQYQRCLEGKDFQLFILLCLPLQKWWRQVFIIDLWLKLLVKEVIMIMIHLVFIMALECSVPPFQQVRIQQSSVSRDIWRILLESLGTPLTSHQTQTTKLKLYKNDLLLKEWELFWLLACRSKIFCNQFWLDPNL